MTKKTKAILIVAFILVAGVALAVTIAVSHSGKPDFSKMEPRQIREFIDSNQFRDANEEKRHEVFEQLGEAMQARMTAQVNKYFALPEGDKRTEYLDKIIDDMEARRAEFEARRDGNRPPDANGPPDSNGFRRFGQRGAGGQRPRMNPERMRARSERTSADTRVKMIQFSQELRARMQERGIQGRMMGPRGGQGGPGGPGR